VTIEEIQRAILKRAAAANHPEGQADTLGSLRNGIAEPDDRRLVSALHLMCEDGRVILTKYVKAPELADGHLRITYSTGMGMSTFLDRGDFYIAASPKGLAWLDQQVTTSGSGSTAAASAPPAKETASSFCRRCSQTTKHIVECAYRRDHGPLPPDFAFIEDHWEILVCNGCGEPSFRRLYADDGNYDPNINEVVEDVELYPPSGPDRRPVRYFKGTSAVLDRIFRESTQAHNDGLRTLAAGGLRATIEAICADKGVVDGPLDPGDATSKRKDNLQGRINGLAEKGHLTRPQADHLHSIRFLGNDALHELAEPQAEELKIAFDLVEETIESIYEREYKAAELRRYRDARKGNP
jgi:hypothetical protein